MTCGVITMKLERLRNLREDHDLTQAQVAQYIHTTQRTYAHYENGDRSIPLETLIALAEFYGTSLDYLTGRTDVIFPYPSKNPTSPKKLNAPKINCSSGRFIIETAWFYKAAPSLHLSRG